MAASAISIHIPDFACSKNSLRRLAIPVCRSPASPRKLPGPRSRSVSKARDNLPLCKECCKNNSNKSGLRNSVSRWSVQGLQLDIDAPTSYCTMWASSYPKSTSITSSRSVNLLTAVVWHCRTTIRPQQCHSEYLLNMRMSVMLHRSI
jgi:hypothetical protein